MKGARCFTLCPALLLAVLLLVLSPAPLAAQTYVHVDDDAPGDPGPGDPLVSDPLEDGSPDHPFDAIQEGIDATATGNIVLLADGLYAGTGNRDLSFQGRKITVRSANGPADCTVDCEGAPGIDRFGFEFVNGEGAPSLLQGLTIIRASSSGGGPGHASAVYIDGASPTITGNVISGCTGGAGITCLDSGAKITGNTITGNSATDGGGILVQAASPLISGNTIEGNSAVLGGGIHVVEPDGESCAPQIELNVITGNHADETGGGICLVDAEPASLAHNLLAGNDADLAGGGLYGLDLDTDSGVTTLRSCTIAGNSAGSTGSDGGGVCLIISEWDRTCTVDFVDCILADNQSDEGKNLWLGSIVTAPSDAVTATLDHCLIKDASQTVRVGHQALVLASPLLTGDPLFTAGPHGDHYLSQGASGQAADSPALDAGSDQAANICTGEGEDTVCLDSLATRTDGVADTGVADLGFHYPAIFGTVSAAMACSPSSGTLPFSSQFTVSLTNIYAGQSRRIQLQIDATLPGGQFFPSWRRGWLNVQAGETRGLSWWQGFQAVGSLVGQTDFLLTAADVTPAPYNQPPYPPAGDTDTAGCTVTGVAP